jgi:hypothetical protein
VTPLKTRLRRWCRERLRRLAATPVAKTAPASYLVGYENGMKDMLEKILKERGA